MFSVYGVVADALQDMKMFASITTAVKTSGKVNAVIMGRKTYESLPNAYKPLPHRWNVVISTTLAPSQPVTGSDVAPIDCSTPFIVASLDEAFALCWSSTHYSQHIEHTFVIGTPLYVFACKRCCLSPCLVLKCD